jgi:hypothetical protein
MTTQFDEVSITATKRWVDDEGHRRQKTKTFSQTVNPWNANKDGAPKTRAEIFNELWEKRTEWLNSEEKT